MTTTCSQEELVWEAMHGPDDEEVKLHVTGTAQGTTGPVVPVSRGPEDEG